MNLADLLELTLWTSENYINFTSNNTTNMILKPAVIGGILQEH